MLKTLAAAGILAAGYLMTAPPVHAELSSLDKQVYTKAFEDAGRDRFTSAQEWAAKAKDPLLGKVVRWMEYGREASGASFEDITKFIRENPDWPYLSLLTRRAEDAITLTTPNQAILDWFSDNRFVTAGGGRAYGEALLSEGRRVEAVKVLRQTWIEQNFGILQERQFLARHREHLRREDHEARLDRLLWDRYDSAARRMLPYVGHEAKLLAGARMALFTGRGNPDSAIARVPAKYRDDPGLVYDRLNWRRKKDFDDGALELLRHPAANQGRPELWWRERAIMARRLLTKGHISEAYAIVKGHGQTEGVPFADGEWLAGWIALRFLDDRKTALTHFTNLYQGVGYPISLSRGAYWAGRAAEALGRKAEAESWYRKAATHITTFYGQLAASKLKDNALWSLPAEPALSAADRQAFANHEMTRIVRALAEIGAFETVRPFVLRLHDTAKTSAQKALAGSLGEQIGRADLGVWVARRADKDHITLVSAGWPIPPLSFGDEPEKSLVLSVIRQESNFYDQAISSAGARGLMQIMPATGKRMASMLNLGFSTNKLVDDPSFNVQLGSAYLAHLLKEFDGSYILTLAAYNAGPSNAKAWLRENGDFRKGDVDIIDWIESIPFYETRNYVQRVLENVQVYRHRLGLDTLHSLEQDLKR